MWQDWAKFRHYDKVKKVLCNYLCFYLVFGQIFSLLGQFLCYWAIFCFLNGQILKEFWSHWFQFSPFHANTFISSGSDREIRIYSLLQPLAPVKIIYTSQDTIVSKLSWSPSRKQYYKTFLLQLMVALITAKIWCVIWAVWPDWVIYCTLGNHLKPLAIINSPKSLTFLGNFCKGVKIIHFFSKIIFGQLL